MENNSSCQHIPLDIIANILLRLPAKSLAIFRCVCKQWNSITNGQDFLNAHRARTLRQLRFIDRWANPELVFYEFYREKNLEKKSFKIKLKGSGQYALSKIVNGVTCASSSPDIYLLNLTTQTLVKSLRFSQRSDYYPDNISLGFDSSKGVYKIVRLFCGRHWNSCFCEVISVGESDVGEWRFIGKISQPLYGICPVFLNGILYWLSWVRQSDLLVRQSSLVTFDVEEEKPGSMVTTFEHPCDLMELDGHLCITYFDSINSQGTWKYGY